MRKFLLHRNSWSLGGVKILSFATLQFTISTKGKCKVNEDTQCKNCFKIGDHYPIACTEPWIADSTGSAKLSAMISSEPIYNFSNEKDANYFKSNISELQVQTGQPKIKRKSKAKIRYSENRLARYNQNKGHILSDNKSFSR